MASFLHLTLAMFLFWHSWLFRQPLAQLITAYFSTDSNACMASPVLHSPGFLFIWQTEQSVIIDDHISHVSSLSYGVPQGSVLGPVLFILYTKPLSDLIQCHSNESQSFTDDTQLQVSVLPSDIQSVISSPETCLSDIQTWMLENKLKLNNDKTRSSSKSFSVGKPTTISVCGCEISFSSFARNLGFYIRDDMSVELHIKNVCRSAFSELRRVSTNSASPFSWLYKNTCVRLCPL